MGQRGDLGNEIENETGLATGLLLLHHLNVTKKKKKKTSSVADCVRTPNICEEAEPCPGTEASGANEHPLYANFTGERT